MEEYHAESRGKMHFLIENISSLSPNFRSHTTDIRISISKELKSYARAEESSRERWVCLIVLGYLFLAIKQVEDSDTAFNIAANMKLYPAYYNSWYCIQCKRRILSTCGVCHSCLSMVCDSCLEQADEYSATKPLSRGCRSDHNFLKFSPDDWIDLPQGRISCQCDTEGQWFSEHINKQYGTAPG